MNKSKIGYSNFGIRQKSMSQQTNHQRSQSRSGTRDRHF